MPKTTFSGVRLQLVGPVNIEAKYDAIPLERFLELKGLIDEFFEPVLPLGEQVSKTPKS